MRIDLRIDPSALNVRVRNIHKRIAFGAVNAVNAAAKDVQAAQFENVRARFTVRQPRFLFGTPERPGGAAARIRPFASVRAGRPFAEISVSGPEGRGGVRRRTLLPGFEEGAPRGPFTPGADRVAVPVTGGAARPSIEDAIRQEFTFAGMRLRAYRAGRVVTRPRRGNRRVAQSLFGTEGRVEDPTGRRAGSNVQFKGQHGTFIVRPDSSLTFTGGGIFRRVGEDVEPVYVFVRPFRLDKRLGFRALARRVGEPQLRRRMEAEMAEAVARSRIAAIGRSS